MSNFDIFKTMTPEQLAKAIARPCYCCAYENSSDECNGKCTSGILEFLNQEAKEGITAENVMNDLGWDRYANI